MLAIEINDVTLAVVRGRDVLIEEPGFVHVDGDRVLLGSSAQARARLEPIYTHNRYWQELSVQPLARPGRQLGTFADLAYAQLSAIHVKVGASGDEALLAVPPHYTREQLGLLLGISQEAGFKTVGLVDAALASAALVTTSANTLLLDLYLHQAVVSVFETGALLRRVRYESQPQLGWLALQARWIDAIAGEFVRRTRFDPLHHAQTEQQLWDRLPQWLTEIDRSLRTDTASTVTMAVEFDGDSIAIEVTSQFMLDAVSVFYSAIIQLAQRAQIAGSMFELLLTQRVATLPGLQRELAAVRNTRVSVLPAAAGALGALAQASVIRREPQHLSLVQRLPVSISESGAVANEGVASMPLAQRPTHVLFDHIAYTISDRPLVVGHTAAAGQRTLAVAAMPGVSRTHCSIINSTHGVQLEDHSTYGTYLNGQRVAGAARLAIGDRITLGAPATAKIELQLIGVAGDTE
jgi:hypothetical protein